VEGRKMKVTRILLMIGILIYLLSACRGQSDVPIATLIPTIKLASSLTPPTSIRSIPTLTVIVTKLPTIDPSWNDCYQTGNSVSPNEDWLAVFCHYPPNTIDGMYTKIYKQGSQLVWVFDNRTFLPFEQTTLPGYPAYWSPDGKYVYIQANPGGDVYWALSNFAVTLYRLDLATGALSLTLPLPTREILPDDQLNLISYAFAFSPDGGSLIYSSPSEESVFHIKSLKTDAQKDFNLGSNYIASGIFKWSTDGTKVVFVGMTESYTKDGLSLLLFNVNEGTVTTVLDHDLRLLIPYEWINQESVTLLSWHLDQPKYVLNIHTGETTIFPTPSAIP
jgi:hypothetical protein